MNRVPRETIEEIYQRLRCEDGPWCLYLNPMRNDGVFVGQEKPFIPYKGVRGGRNQLLYPAVPYAAKSVGYQLPHAEAERLVSMLNEKGSADGFRPQDSDVGWQDVKERTYPSGVVPGSLRKEAGNWRGW